MRTRIAMETGTQSGWISRFLKSYGHEVLVVFARDLQGIGRRDRKNDRNDAEKLATRAWTRSFSIRLSTAPNSSKPICAPFGHGMPGASAGAVGQQRTRPGQNRRHAPAGCHHSDVGSTGLGSAERRPASRAQAAAGAGRSARSTDCGLRRDAGTNRRPTLSGRDQSAVLGARGGDTDLGITAKTKSIGRARSTTGYQQSGQWLSCASSWCNVRITSWGILAKSQSSENGA